MRRTDFVAAATFVVLVLALEFVARGRRSAEWGWLLYAGSAVSLFLFYIGRVKFTP